MTGTPPPQSIRRPMARLLARLSEIFHHPGGWEWAALIVGGLEISRGALVFWWGAGALHPTFPAEAASVSMPIEFSRWVFLFSGIWLVIATIAGRLVAVRIGAMVSMFILASTAVIYFGLQPPYRLYIQGATHAILAVTAALIYVAAGDARGARR